MLIMISHKTTNYQKWSKINEFAIVISKNIIQNLYKSTPSQNIRVIRNKYNKVLFMVSFRKKLIVIPALSKESESRT